MAKTVLVTGGAGYIGSHVALELLNAGYEVVVADNMSNCDETCYNGVRQLTNKDIPFWKIDCCDSGPVNELFSAHNIDAVIHFAAYKSVGESVAEPVKYYRNNIGSFLTVLEAAKKHGATNILFSSSATVYGNATVLPVTEQTPRQKAASPYGNTKQICEDILSDAVKATANESECETSKGKPCYKRRSDNAGTDLNGAIKGISLRYFNPIGAHPSALLGELPRGVPNNLVPFIAQTAIGKLECLSIFGNDYPTPDGTCLRDYIDIVDLAKAHVSAVERMLGGKMEENYEVFNIGTGRPLSVLELVTAFERVNNLKINYKFASRRAGDVEAIWADPTKANQELGWKAERTIDETLASAWAWEQHIADATK